MKTSRIAVGLLVFSVAGVLTGKWVRERLAASSAISEDVYEYSQTKIGFGILSADVAVAFELGATNWSEFSERFRSLEVGVRFYPEARNPFPDYLPEGDYKRITEGSIRIAEKVPLLWREMEVSGGRIVYITGDGDVGSVETSDWKPTYIRKGVGPKE